MKQLFILLIGVLLLSFPAFAQTKIAVVDVKVAVDKYHKKGTLSEELNASALEKTSALNKLKASYQSMTAKMVGYDEAMNDLSLSNEVRGEAREKLVTKSAERDILAREIDSKSRKVQTELNSQRDAMESILAKDIKAMVMEVAAAKGFDLAFDKSYLPNSEYKSILYTSDNIVDLTEDVIARLNANR